MSRKPRRPPPPPALLTRDQATELTATINGIMGEDRLWVLAYADLRTGHNNGLMSNSPEEGAHRQMLELSLESLGHGVVEPLYKDS